MGDKEAILVRRSKGSGDPDIYMIDGLPVRVWPQSSGPVGHPHGKGQAAINWKRGMAAKNRL